MYNTSINCDAIVKLLSENEFGFLLLQNDGKNPLFDILAQTSTYEDRQCMFDNKNKSVEYHLFPLLYGKKYAEGIEKIRNAAVYNLFARWTDAGYNHHYAKNPYGSKAFMDYLDSIEFTKADYMLLLVN